MNMTPEKLLLIIGKQQVMIELLQEKVKSLQEQPQSGTGLTPGGPPAWTQAKVADGDGLD